MKALKGLGKYVLEVMINIIMLEVCSFIPKIAFKVFPYEEVSENVMAIAVVLGLIAGTYAWQLFRFTPANALLISLEFYIGFCTVLPLILYYVIYSGDERLAVGVSSMLMLMAILICCVALGIYKVVKKVRNKNN